MGCSASKQPAASAEKAAPAAEKPPAQASPGSTREPSKETAAQVEKPKPQVVAVMRNGHEVLRGAMRDMAEALESGDALEFRGCWESFKKWSDIHAAMEEGVPGKGRGMFAFLDQEADNTAANAQLHEEHAELDVLERAVVDAVQKNAAAEELKLAYTAFAERYELHMTKEEDAMMPEVMRLAKSGFDLKTMVRTELMTCVGDDDMAFFLTFAMKTLEKHHGGQPRARVFAHAVWAASTAHEWPSRHEALKEGLSVELYGKVKAECDF